MGRPDERHPNQLLRYRKAMETGRFRPLRRRRQRRRRPPFRRLRHRPVLHQRKHSCREMQRAEVCPYRIEALLAEAFDRQIAVHLVRPRQPSLG